MRELVIGADIGGTSTRVGVADTSGQILALCTGGPGNPTSVGMDGSAAEIRTVMDRALNDVAVGHPGSSPGNHPGAQIGAGVVAVVIGLAGGSRAVVVPNFLRAATSTPVAAPARLVSDLTVAFCSATPAPEGYVIVSGTGAVAGQVVATELVQQRDGWGWLLGDEGSGFWLGREAVRATLDGLQQATPGGPLQRAVMTATRSNGYLDLLHACYAATPTWLAQFSSLVSQHAADDPVASDIADRAAALLERLLFSLDPRPDVPIVLAGSVLTKQGPISQSFRGRLSRRAVNPVLTSTTSVIGALWIGLQSRVGDSTVVHDRLVATARRWA